MKGNEKLCVLAIGTPVAIQQTLATSQTYFKSSTLMQDRLIGSTSPLLSSPSIILTIAASSSPPHLRTNPLRILS